jgi:hypothetical protein
MTLRYLHFDATEANDGNGCFDTMASVSPSALVALHGELALVLGWAHQTFPGGSGPLDDGHDWDHDLQATQERTRQENLVFDAGSGSFSATMQMGESLRHTVSLSISGTANFCVAFRARFMADGA